MIHRITAVAVAVFFAVAPSSGGAQTRGRIDLENTDPRGDPELTVCSQNLENYGPLPVVLPRVPGMNKDRMREKEGMLVSRFLKAGCDVIAVQEVLGKTEENAKEGLLQLAKRIRERSGRVFVPYVGPVSEGALTIGFLVAPDRAEMLNLVSYDRVELPKLTDKQKPRLFARGPLEIQLSVKGKGDSPSKNVSLVNIHFKSKRGGKGDPAGTEYETLRMEMAEALRRIVENRHAASFNRKDQLVMVLGDRNSHFDVASARILEGSITLKEFQEGAPCRLSGRGVPLCKPGYERKQVLFSVLQGDPQTKHLPGTFKFRKEFSWLDEILMPAALLPLAWQNAAKEGDYDSGVVYEPAGSDHALVYVRLNW